MSYSPSATKRYLCSTMTDIPPELFAEILSHLDIPTIKVLSLASSNFHMACFPYLFRGLSLNGDLRPAPKFFSTFEGRRPIPCLQKIELKWLKDDISTALLPWCTKAHIAKTNGSLIGNTAILPSLTLLKELELANLSFPSLADYFALLSSLPLTLNQLKIRKNRFRECQSAYTCNRTIKLKCLETHSAGDLAPFLRVDCPVYPLGP
ncbi:hypothetical protein EDD18DRAFT_1366907 [Armillaria luteobubalina]|uniref:F-box domain-containing protein n=1 Tax=Armillaria luteobubalina TaxID=153913 RepID=A0AA39UAX3_9AGAR|nr:hypothetical protein EDD18DRAFT_1366907 [Armillaria luteobubalina]